MGTLFIVSTPIGNLEDMTFRAVKVLGDADIILAEDTRTAGNLLKHFQIPYKQIISFFEGNENSRLSDILQQLSQGKKIALISESGTPLISDPGFKLVREAKNIGVKIEAIPGPTALINALVVSGLPANAFIFLGFLPKKEAKTKNILERTKLSLSQIDEVKTVILYESPHRLIKTLTVINDVYGDIQIVVAREMTKIYEEIRREKVSESIVHFTKTSPRGEFTVVFSTI